MIQGRKNRKVEPPLQPLLLPKYPEEGYPDGIESETSNPLLLEETIETDTAQLIKETDHAPQGFQLAFPRVHEVVISLSKYYRNLGDICWPIV